MAKQFKLPEGIKSLLRTRNELALMAETIDEAIADAFRAIGIDDLEMLRGTSEEHVGEPLTFIEYGSKSLEQDMDLIEEICADWLAKEKRNVD